MATGGLVVIAAFSQELPSCSDCIILAYRLFYPVAIGQHPLQCDISSRRELFH